MLLLRSAIDFALPPRCPGCGLIVDADHRFCVECWGRLDFLTGLACAGCGEPFELARRDGARCARCRAEPSALDGVRAAVAYDEIARGLALKLKHGGRTGIAITVARAMARLLPAGEGWLLVPVPLHRWRLWRRGYNQAALIARALAREHAMTLSLDLIERVRATPMLKGRGRAERARTVRGAFRLNPRAPAPRGARIVLVDDVFTTGATAAACAKVLKAAGAAEVRLVCWARVEQPGAPER